MDIETPPDKEKPINYEVRPFEEAIQFVHSLKLRNVSEWEVYYKAGKIPKDIPFDPDRAYNGEWKGWNHWLGTYTLPYTAHILWIGVAIILVVAIYLAYTDIMEPNVVNSILPHINTTAFYESNGTIIKPPHDPQGRTILSSPIIPRFVIWWGLIGAAIYVLKVITLAMSEKRYDNSYLPDHIARLFYGPGVAVASYFILGTGSIIGLSIDITKIPFGTLPYLYAIVAFLAGYFVRPIIHTMSRIVNALFMLNYSESDARHNLDKRGKQKTT